MNANQRKNRKLLCLDTVSHNVQFEMVYLLYVAKVVGVLRSGLWGLDFTFPLYMFLGKFPKATYGPDVA